MSAYLIPLHKYNSITAKAMGLIVSLLDIDHFSLTDAFGILQYIQGMHHGLIGLTFVLLCVPVFLLSEQSVDSQWLAGDGFPTFVNRLYFP